MEPKQPGEQKKSGASPAGEHAKPKSDPQSALGSKENFDKADDKLKHMGEKTQHGQHGTKPGQNR